MFYSSINNEDLNLKLKELENKLKMEAEQREEGLLKRYNAIYIITSKWNFSIDSSFFLFFALFLEFPKKTSKYLR